MTEYRRAWLPGATWLQTTPEPMEDRFLVTCPYCGEDVEIYLEPDVEGSLVQDCDVCCNPWQLRIWTDGDHRHVAAARADGSE